MRRYTGVHSCVLYIMHEYTYVPKSIPMCPKVYQCAQKYTNVPKSIPMCPKVYQCAQRYTNVPKSIPMCPKVYQCAQKYTYVPKSIPMCPEVYQCSQGGDAPPLHLVPVAPVTMVGVHKGNYPPRTVSQDQIFPDEHFVYFLFFREYNPATNVREEVWGRCGEGVEG